MAMEIEVGAKDVLTASKNFDKLATSQEKAAASTSRLAKATQDLDKARAQASGGGGGVPASARGGGAKDRFTSGPEQKLLDLKEQRARAEMIRNMERRSAVLKDISRAEFLAQRSIKLHADRMKNPEESLNRPGLLELFGTLNSLMAGLKGGNILGISRSLMQGINLVTPGGLNNQQTGAGWAASGPQAAAPSAAAGAVAANLARAGMNLPVPVGMASVPVTAQAGGAASSGAGLAAGVGVAAIGLFALAKGAEFAARQIGEASERAGAFARTMTVTGGTGGETARLGAIGADPGASNALRERLAHDGLAQMTAMSMGVGPVAPQAYGPQDNAKLHQQLLEGLRTTYKVAGAEEALRKARLLGLDAELDLVKVSDRVWQAEKRQAEQRAGIMDERTTQAARDLNAELKLTSEHMSDLQASLAKPGIPDATRAAEGFNNILAGVTDFANKYQGIAHGLMHAAMPPLLQQAMDFAEFFSGHGHGSGGGKAAPPAKDDLQKQHIKALQALAEALNRAYGDHGRAGSTVPVGRQGNAAAPGLEGALAAMEFIAGPW